MISRAQKPASIAFSARFWDRTANSSSSWRDRPRSAGDVLRGLAHRDVDVGEVAGLARVVPHVLAALGRASSLRASASANRGLWVSGQWSEVPLAKRETVSTPAEMITSASPALIAWKAIRVVCTDDAQ